MYTNNGKLYQQYFFLLFLPPNMEGKQTMFITIKFF